MRVTITIHMVSFDCRLCSFDSLGFENSLWLPSVVTQIELTSSEADH